MHRGPPHFHATGPFSPGSPGCRLLAPGYRRLLLALGRSRAVIAGEHRDEGLLRNLHGTHHLHALLALLLLLQQLPLTGDVTAVALGEDVLADGADGLAGDHAGADGGLDRYLEGLPRD